MNRRVRKSGGGEKYLQLVCGATKVLWRYKLMVTVVQMRRYKWGKSPKADGGCAIDAPSHNSKSGCGRLWLCVEYVRQEGHEYVWWTLFAPLMLHGYLWLRSRYPYVLQTQSITSLRAIGMLNIVQQYYTYTERIYFLCQTLCTIIVIFKPCKTFFG